jgi:DNA recombination protein RmuC
MSLEIVIIVSVSITTIITLLLFFKFSEMKGRLGQSSDDQSKQQSALFERIQSHERALHDMLQNRLDKLTERVHGSIESSTNKTQDSLTQLKERIAVLDAAQQKITDLSSEVVTLQDILSNKQSRGAFGEIQLNDIITTILPPNAYSFQATLSNGRRVDCLLQIPHPPGPIAVDSKFPLESYRALISDEDKKIAKRQFRADILKHIKDIHDKYIIPGETADSALMFLPSEAIYAELHTNYTDIVQISFEHKVWIVSPTTMMATLNTLRGILKDARLQEQSHIIQSEVSKLKQDVLRLSTRTQKLSSHFKQCQDDVSQIIISSEKIVKKTERIESIELGTTEKSMVDCKELDEAV